MIAIGIPGMIMLIISFYVWDYIFPGEDQYY